MEKFERASGSPADGYRYADGPGCTPAVVTEYESVAHEAELSITWRGQPLLLQSLDLIPSLARIADGEVFVFLYRDPYDPDNPNELRPLKRARLVLDELGEVGP